MIGVWAAMVWELRYVIVVVIVVVGLLVWFDRRFD